MIKTYHTKKFYEVVSLLSNVNNSNEVEIPPRFFKDINIKPSYNEKGKVQGFNISILTSEIETDEK